MRRFSLVLLLSLALLPFSITAQEDAGGPETAQAQSAAVAEADVQPETVPDALSLDELLDAVRSGRLAEERANEARVARFRREQSNRQQMLNDIITEEQRQEAISKQRESRFEENESQISELEERLKSVWAR